MRWDLTAWSRRSYTQGLITKNICSELRIYHLGMIQEKKEPGILVEYEPPVRLGHKKGRFYCWLYQVVFSIGTGRY